MLELRHGCITIVVPPQIVCNKARQSLYCTSKAALYSYANVLKTELAEGGYAGVKVACICPWRNVAPSKVVAQIAVETITNKNSFVVVPSLMSLIHPMIGYVNWTHTGTCTQCKHKCAYTRIHTHTHAHTHTHTHTHAHTHTHTHNTHTSMYIHIHTHIHTHAHTRTHSYTHTRTHTHTRKHVRTHTHTHTFIHAHTHMHTHTRTYVHIHMHAHTTHRVLLPQDYSHFLISTGCYQAAFSQLLWMHSLPKQTVKHIVFC